MRASLLAVAASALVAALAVSAGPTLAADGRRVINLDAGWRFLDSVTPLEKEAPIVHVPA